MTHRWSIPDGMWLADGPWTCDRCLATADLWVDTRTAGPCARRYWPFTADRLARFTATARSHVGVATGFRGAGGPTRQNPVAIRACDRTPPSVAGPTS